MAWTSSLMGNLTFELQIQLLTKFGEDRMKYSGQTDRPTDRPTNAFTARKSGDNFCGASETPATIIQLLTKFGEDRMKYSGQTDRPTDRPTNAFTARKSGDNFCGASETPATILRW
ncbi:hypothetical protein DPMN_036775 [Dreissena polymorpha]|uniref:Uncharacterized protein n=1 Tax=Dreissena polymorpha TaxID=45954 RepID=A0A9D4RNG0_DREPO|nr:hypothetical protein DPMN_036775 [Dreissena polymorpha]